MHVRRCSLKVRSYPTPSLPVFPPKIEPRGHCGATSASELFPISDERFCPSTVANSAIHPCLSVVCSCEDTFLDGLWLDAGVVDDIPKLLSTLEDLESFNVRPFSALTIGRILVVYFKKLPAPLLTLELHDHLRGAAQLEVFEDENARVRYLGHLLRTLPVPNYYTLGKLLRVFAKVWNEQNGETQKSTLDIWAPILVLRENVHDMAMDLPWATHLLRVLIENHERIYPKKKFRQLDPTIATSRQNGGSSKLPRSTPSSSAATPGGGATSSILTEDSIGSDARLSLNWLSAMNAEKVKTMELYLSKMNDLLKEFQDCMPDSCEMMHCLELCVLKMTCMVDSLSMNPKALPRLIDAYHLDRCHVFVVDLHTAIKKSRTGEDRFLRFFDTRALHGTIQRMYLSLQHELSLAFDGVDTLLGGAIKNDPRNQAKFRRHTIQLIQQQEASDWWAVNFGAQSFSVSWENFSKRLLNATSRLSELYSSTQQKEQALAHLRNVLDDAQTNFITVYKFAKFLAGFGDLNVAVHNCISIVSKPWFHGYVSKREAARFLEPFEPSTFLIRFASLEPSSFAVNFKDDSHQLYSINVDVEHRPIVENHTSSANSLSSGTSSSSTDTQRSPSAVNAQSTTIGSAWASGTPTALHKAVPHASAPGSLHHIPSISVGSKSSSSSTTAATDAGVPSEPTKPVYVVMEGTESREFTSMEEMIENYADFLQKTVAYKMLIQPWFYGEFTAQECQGYLQHEPVGTFLVRFSSHHAKLTLDYVSEDGTVIQHRLERTVDGKIANGNLLFEDIDHFVSETKGLRFPYKHDNQVSTTQEEETTRRSNENIVGLLQDPEPILCDTLLAQLMASQSKTLHDGLGGVTPRGASAAVAAILDSQDTDAALADTKIIVNGQPSTYLQMNQASIISLVSQKMLIESMPILSLPAAPTSASPSPSATPSALQYASNLYGPLGQDMRNTKKDVLDNTLSSLLTKIAYRTPVSFKELVKLTSVAFSFDATTYHNVQTRIHKDLTGTSMLRKKGVTVSPQFLTAPKTMLHRLSQCEFKIKNRNKCEMRYVIEGPTAITTHAFFALSSSSGVLKSGESVKIAVSVVLFKPCVMHELLFVHLDDGSHAASSQSGLGSAVSAAAVSTANQNMQTFAIPFTIAVDKQCMWQELDRFWTIPEDFLADIRAGNFQKKLGAGAAATVFLASLYGVNVAVKVWDIGSRNMPPPDFDQELNIMAAIHHPNLVRFVGAAPGRGQGALVMEFVSGGSLDKYLKFRQPDDGDMARAEAESRSGSTQSTDAAFNVTIRNLNLSGDPNVTVTNSQSGTSQTYKVSAEHELSSSSSTCDTTTSTPSSLRIPTTSPSGTPSSSSSSNLSVTGGSKSPRSTTTGTSSSSPASVKLPTSLTGPGGAVGAVVPPSNNPATPLSGYHNFMGRVPIALDTAKALLYLHERNLIHRDVKTLNVLINKESLSTRLSDFGEAATRDANLNEMVGSTPWMAPEVCLSEYYSSKADVFSFGLVLYELLLESYPVRTLHMVAEGMIPKIPTSYALAYPAYVRLIHACTLRNPDKRPTMFSVVRELEKIQAVTQIRRVRGR